MYRTREQRLKYFRENGGKSRNDNWFRRKTGEGKQVTSVFRVPFTRGKLASRIREGLEKFDRPEGIKVRVQEGGGNKLKDILVRQDPFPRVSCGREKCPIGRICKERCYQGHVNYEMVCVECEENRKDGEKKYVYFGETSRGGYIRNEGHCQAYRKGEEGFMVNHAREVHQGRKDLKFSMRCSTRDPDPLRRVLRESVKIKRASCDKSVTLMNSKNEYFGTQILRPQFTYD